MKSRMIVKKDSTKTDSAKVVTKAPKKTLAQKRRIRNSRTK